MISRALIWALEAVLISLILFLPWVFGSVHARFELWLAYGLAAVLGLWALRTVLERRVTWAQGSMSGLTAAGLYGLFLVALVQTLVMPRAVVATLSPNVVQTVSELIPADREQIKGFSQPIASSSKWSVGHRLSLNPGGSYHFSLRLLGLAALFAAVSSLPSPRSVLFRISIAAAVVGSALAIFGIAQYFGSPRDLIYWTFKSSGAGFSSFISRNHYPFYANLALGLTTGLLLDRYERQGRNWFSLLTQDTWAMWFLAGMVFIMSSIIVCVSRGGVVAMVVALITCFAVRYRRGHNTGAVSIVVALVAGAAITLTWVGFDFYSSRLTTLVESDQLRDDGRWYLWAAALTTAWHFPLTGSGGETFRYWETIVNQSELWNSFQSFAYRADNEFLDVFAEYGIFGLVALVMVASGVLIQGFQLARRDGLAAGAFMGLTACVVHSCLDFGLRVPATAVFATITAALLCNLRKSVSDPGDARVAARAEVATATDERTTLVSQVGAICVAVTCVCVGYYLVQEKRRAALSERHADIGLGALETNDLTACVEHMTSSARAAPEDERSQLYAARIILRAADATTDARSKHERIARALELCVQARDLCPLAYEPYLCLAQQARYLQRGESVQQYLAKAHRLHPSSSEISFALGLTLYDAGRYEEAWPIWHQSLRFTSSYLHEILGRVRTQLSPEQIIALVLPSNAATLVAAADLAESAGARTERDAYLKRALELMEEESTEGQTQVAIATKYELKARVFEKLGEPDKAIDAYRQAILHRPDAIEWRLTLALLLLSQERFDEAFREVRNVLVFQPENQNALGLRERILKLQAESKKLVK